MKTSDKYLSTFIKSPCFRPLHLYHHHLANNKRDSSEIEVNSHYSYIQTLFSGSPFYSELKQESQHEATCLCSIPPLVTQLRCPWVAQLQPHWTSCHFLNLSSVLCFQIFTLVHHLSYASLLL